MQRYLPDAFIFALLLTFLTMVLAVVFTPSGPGAVTAQWGEGFWFVIEFSMQASLALLTGWALADSPPVKRVLRRLATIPNSQQQAIFATAVVGQLLGLFHWGVVLIAGAIFAREVGIAMDRTNVDVHYPLVVTGALLSLVLANQGPSSPGALIMADTSDVTNVMLDSAGSIGMTGFVFEPANVVSSAVLIVTLPLVLVALAPDNEADRTGLDETESILSTTIAETLDHYSPPPREEYTVADRLEQSWVISLIAVVLGAVSVGWHFATGDALTLPWLLFFLMILGLLVQGRPMAFRSKTTGATRWANHVAIPFLLYAVVFALLSEAGLYAPIGNAMGAIGSTAIGSFVAAFGLGLVVPDPGSLWVVIGPALVTTDLDLITSLVTVMYGAELSNLWLGFLFAGILSIRGFDWREYLRYVAILSVYVVIVVVVVLLAV